MMALSGILSFALTHWRLIAEGVGLTVLTLALMLARGEERHWHKAADACALARKMEALASEKAASDATAKAQAALASASDAYAARTAVLATRHRQSDQEVIRYAETPAGAAACLGADRVRAIDAADASLDAPAPANISADAVHADAGAPAD